MYHSSRFCIYCFYFPPICFPPPHFALWFSTTFRTCSLFLLGCLQAILTDNLSCGLILHPPPGSKSHLPQGRSRAVEPAIEGLPAGKIGKEVNDSELETQRSLIILHRTVPFVPNNTFRGERPSFGHRVNLSKRLQNISFIELFTNCSYDYTLSVFACEPFAKHDHRGLTTGCASVSCNAEGCFVLGKI